MHSDDEEYIAYRPDKYTHLNGEHTNMEDENDFMFDEGHPSLKWNHLMYDNSLGSDVSFKRVKRQEEDESPPEPEETPGGDGDGGGGSDKKEAETPKLYMTPVIGITAFFALVFILGPLMVRKGPNRGIVQCSIMLSAFCMWIFWVTVYIGQMNPLMGPRLHNTTVAWLALKVGNPLKPPESGGGGGGE